MSLNLIIILYYILGSPVEVFVDLHVESFGNIEEASMVRVSFTSVKQALQGLRFLDENCLGVLG